MIARTRGRMPQDRLPDPPDWCPEPERSWWTRVVTEFDLDDDALVMLELAVGAMVRWREARETIEREGMLLDGRWGPRAHPAVAIERDARTAALRALRELDLSGQPLPYPKRDR